jgi:hypothetical protein
VRKQWKGQTEAGKRLLVTLVRRKASIARLSAKWVPLQGWWHSHSGPGTSHLVLGLGCPQKEGAERHLGCPAQEPQHSCPEKAHRGFPSGL